MPIGQSLIHTAVKSMVKGKINGKNYKESIDKHLLT